MTDSPMNTNWIYVGTSWINLDHVQGVRIYDREVHLLYGPSHETSLLGDEATTFATAWRSMHPTPQQRDEDFRRDVRRGLEAMRQDNAAHEFAHAVVNGSEGDFKIAMEKLKSERGGAPQ